PSAYSCEVRGTALRSSGVRLSLKNSASSTLSGGPGISGDGTTGVLAANRDFSSSSSGSIPSALFCSSLNTSDGEGRIEASTRFCSGSVPFSPQNFWYGGGSAW